MRKYPTDIIAVKGVQELFISTEFDAPPELVFRAFTEPELVAQWLGPDTGTLHIEHMESRSGGGYRFIHDDCNSSGRRFTFNGVFHRVQPPELIVRTFEFEELDGHDHVQLEFLYFEALPANRTLIRIHCVFRSVEERDGMIASGMEQGMNAGFAKLDSLFAAALHQR